VKLKSVRQNRQPKYVGSPSHKHHTASRSKQRDYLIAAQDTTYLLTSLPIENQADVERVVYLYALRWRIERFHYTLKSGALNVEKLQFDDIDSTLNALSFYSVVAWQLLALTYFIRQEADAPPKRVFEEEEIEILKKISKKDIQTVKQAVLALVKIFGFAPSKKQPFPGIKVLAQALERLYFIKVGANIA
jgi:hypothetical protein